MRLANHDAIAERLPAAAGSYLLVLRLDEEAVLRVGALGAFRFPAGLYVYAGSARGPGGVRARAGRHLNAHRTLHWHIDHLLRIAAPVGVWTRLGRRRLECIWARAMASDPGFYDPAPRFGASDCHCPSHLWRLRNPRSHLRRLLSALPFSPACLWQDESVNACRGEHP